MCGVSDIPPMREYIPPWWQNPGPLPISRQEWLILGDHQWSKSNTELIKSRHNIGNYLNFLSRNYENFPTLPWGLWAWDCDWMWLHCTFYMGAHTKSKVPFVHYHYFWLMMDDHDRGTSWPNDRFCVYQEWKIHSVWIMSIYTHVIIRKEDPYPIVHLVYHSALWLIQSHWQYSPATYHGPETMGVVTLS